MTLALGLRPSGAGILQAVAYTCPRCQQPNIPTRQVLLTQEIEMPARWGVGQRRSIECPACRATVRAAHWWTLGLWTVAIGFSVPLALLLLAVGAADAANQTLKEQWLQTHDSLVGIDWHAPNLLPTGVGAVLALVVGFWVGMRRIRLVPTDPQ